MARLLELSLNDAVTSVAGSGGISSRPVSAHCAVAEWQPQGHHNTGRVVAVLCPHRAAVKFADEAHQVQPQTEVGSSWRPSRPEYIDWNTSASTGSAGPSLRTLNATRR